MILALYQLSHSCIFAKIRQVAEDICGKDSVLCEVCDNKILNMNSSKAGLPWWPKAHSRALHKLFQPGHAFQIVAKPVLTGKVADLLIPDKKKNKNKNGHVYFGYMQVDHGLPSTSASFVFPASMCPSSRCPSSLKDSFSAANRICRGRGCLRAFIESTKELAYLPSRLPKPLLKKQLPVPKA